MQQWMAQLVNGEPVVTQLTHQQFDCYGNMPSRFQDGKPPRIAYTHDWPIWKAKAAWIFADKPQEPHQLRGFDYRQMSMWSALGPDFLFVKRSPGAAHGQIARANADTGVVQVLTDDEGEKNDPGLFAAPEFDGETLLVCNVDNRALAIYRDLKSPDGFWTRIAALKLPVDAPHSFISSPESIAPATGIGSMSYFALLARESNDRNSPGSIWVLGLGKDEKNRFARRVDDGAVTGELAVVLEPEPFVGKNEVYVYYNYFDLRGGRRGLRRAITGLKVDRVQVPLDNPSAATNTMFRRTEIAGLTDTPVAVNGFAFADLNRDGLPDVIATRQVRTGFFAPPGEELPQDRLDLFINRGGMNFKPHTIRITGSDLTPERFGVSAEIPNLADFNGDGFLDIFVTRSGGTRFQKHGNTLLLSDGAWDTFRDVSAAMGVQNQTGYNRQSSVGDVNGDGWLDIAIGCDTIGRPDRVGAPHSRLFVFQPNGHQFTDGQFEDTGGTDLVPGFGGYTGDPDKDKAGPGITLRDLDNDGDLDLMQTYHADMTGASQTDREAAGNYAQGVWVWKNILRETKSFRFERVKDNGLAEYARIRWNADKELYEPVAVGSGLPYVAMADTDHDGLLDILAVGPNSTYWAPRAEYTGGRFWRNLGGFRFQRATTDAGFASLDWTYKEIYEFNEWPMPSWLRDTSARKPRAQATNRRGRNRSNLQPGIPLHGPGGSHPYFSDAVFWDFDNDGWIDVVVLDRSESRNAAKRAMLFMNLGNGTFEPKPTTFSGLDASGISGEAADLNNDGLLDLVFAADPDNSSGGRTPQPEQYQDRVYWNTGLHGAHANHWLRLRFSGVTDAELIGARVEVREPGSGRILGSPVIAADHCYKSGSALEAHFGLGKATTVDVAVTPLGGKPRTFPAVTTSRFLELDLKTQFATVVGVAR